MARAALGRILAAQLPLDMLDALKVWFNRPRTQWSLGTLLGLVVLAVVYFQPLLQGKVPNAHDMQAIHGTKLQVQEHLKQTGEQALWTDRMFSGMPAYLIVYFPQGNGLKYLWDGLRSGIDGTLLIYILMLIQGFWLLQMLRTGPLLAAAGAIGYAFISYHLVILNVGHFNKLLTLAMVPGVLHGFLLVYRNRWVGGGLYLTLNLTLMVIFYHIQMAYYLAFILVFIGIWHLFLAARSGQLSKFLLATGIAVAAAGLAFLQNSSLLLPFQEYTKYSIRGASVLTKEPEALVGLTQQTTPNSDDTGLDKDYAFRWSNTRAELFASLIPNYLGGAAEARPIEPGHAAIARVTNAGPAGAQVLPQLMQQGWRTNFGAEGNVAGPYYLGAVLLFLFLVGGFLVNSGLKYALLYGTLLGALLSLGKYSPSLVESLVLLALPLVFHFSHRRVNLAGPIYGALLGVAGLVFVFGFGSDPNKSYRLVDFFFDYFPLYNRFRVPGSVLVMAGMCVPWLAILGARELFNNERPKQVRLTALYTAFALTGGLTLLVALSPESFHDSFYHPSEQQQLQSMQGNEYLPYVRAFYSGVAEERAGLVQNDALRSFGFILVAALLGWLFVQGRIQDRRLAAGAILLLVGLDMVGVGWRYLNHDDYVKRSVFTGEVVPSAADQALAQQLAQGERFRVFPVHRDPFNDGRTPAFLPTVGGYNAAKLHRYQELIELHLNTRYQHPAANQLYAKLPRGGVLATPGVLNMLNTRYLIAPAAKPNEPPVQGTRVPLNLALLSPNVGGEAIIENKGVYGPAWMVEKVAVKPSPDDVLVSLYTTDLATTALVEASAAAAVAGVSSDSLQADEEVRLTEAGLLALKYRYKSDKSRFVVFSEIHYPPDWEATIDGQPAEIVYTNYVLRGLKVPAGEHEIVFRNVPKTFNRANTLSLIGSVLFFLALLGGAGWAYLRWKRAAPRTEESPTPAV